MGGAAAVRGARRRSIAAAVVLAAALYCVLSAASGARAAELLYFENNPLQGQLAVIDLGSSVGSPLNTVGARVEGPEGISYDPVTNRLYVTSSGFTDLGHISYLNLDGSDGGVMALPPGTPALIDPRGGVVDPVGRVLYWLNNTDSGPVSISWARLDGSEGGQLPVAGQALLGAVRLTADPESGRLYWGTSDGLIHYAPLLGNAGIEGRLEAEANNGIAEFLGIAVDPAASRIFWAESGANSVWSAGLSGSVKSEVVGAGSAAINRPLGLAFDPSLNRLYWANSGDENSAKGALGFADLGSPAAEITPTGIPVARPQDPLVIKSPSGLALPAISVANGVLSCSPGTWRGDNVASFVYQSPRGFSYQWTLNEAPIPGATGGSLTPSVSGRYKCVVTATNQAGSTSRTSPGVQATVTTTIRPGKTTTRQVPRNQKPAHLELLGKARHLKARPGKLLTLKVRTTNQGTVASNPAKLCLKLTKGAKRALRAGRCQRLGALKGGATDVAKLRLRVKRKAQPGLYKLRIAVPGDQIKVTVRVLP